MLAGFMHNNPQNLVGAGFFYGLQSLRVANCINSNCNYDLTAVNLAALLNTNFNTLILSLFNPTQTAGETRPLHIPCRWDSPQCPVTHNVKCQAVICRTWVKKNLYDQICPHVWRRETELKRKATRNSASSLEFYFIFFIFFVYVFLFCFKLIENCSCKISVSNILLIKWFEVRQII